MDRTSPKSPLGICAIVGGLAAHSRPACKEAPWKSRWPRRRQRAHAHASKKINAGRGTVDKQWGAGDRDRASD